MIIKKFRVKNYKSIIDSGDCYLTDTITIFAGKNESGKTSILEALEDFDTNKEMRDSAKPIKSPESIPEVSITFIVEKEILEEVFKEITIQPKEIADVEIEVIKTFPNNYSFGENTLLSGISTSEETGKIEKSIKNKLDTIKNFFHKYDITASNIPDVKALNYEAVKSELANYSNDEAQIISKIEDEDARINYFELLKDIQAEIINLEKDLVAKARFLEALKTKWIPNFILFNSFEDIFPNKIPFGELEDNEWIQDLCMISDLRVDTIKSAGDREKEKHRDDVNIKLNADYQKFWTQDISNLSVNWDSENLYFWIKEEGYPYEPSLRSKGRQWHLAFYIKVSARAREDVANIILIDEPGLFLHAKAQEDILEKLEDSAEKVQLIFSTHSPYLLEAEKLNRVRLIHRTKDKGTQIENKVHALADKETLTPILTAIGLELNAGISALDKKNNVIVEGPSDVYYLNAFKLLLNKNSINFVFGGGAGNMPFVGTIIHGWGGNVVYLYDNDQGRGDGEKNLKRNWGMSDNLILSVMQTGGSIEEIFSTSDFRKYILNDSNIQYNGTNAEYVKKHKRDKVLLAKQFLETCQSGKQISFDDTTSANINSLFALIESKF